MTDDDLVNVAAECQRVARVFADRQNSPSTLTPREASAVVNATLNAGNLLEQIVRDRRQTAAASQPTGE